MIDTGAGYSAITEKEAELMNLDSSILPYFKGDCFGFGGKFKNKVINHPVHLTFGTSNTQPLQHKINFASGFQVTCVPRNLSPDEREEIMRHTPCVIGTDILKQFKLFIDYDKRIVQLEL